MKLVRIFDGENPETDGGLYAMQYTGGRDEYNRFIKLWTDPGYLLTFFKENLGDLNSGFYGRISIDEAIIQTEDEAYSIIHKINYLTKEGFKSGENLQNFFRPLNDKEHRLQVLQESKASAIVKGVKNPWLRIYAIRIAPNTYVITGSTIKLTKNMDEREHTNDELDKFKKAIAFLKSEEIYSIDDIIYYYDNTEK